MKKELLRELLETKQYKQLHALLMKESEVDIAYLLQQLELEECAIAFRLLSKKQAARVFSNMDIQRQKQLVELFSEIELIALVENQYMDDLVDLVGRFTSKSCNAYFKSCKCQSTTNNQSTFKLSK